MIEKEEEYNPENHDIEVNMEKYKVYNGKWIIIMIIVKFCV